MNKLIITLLCIGLAGVGGCKSDSCNRVSSLISSNRITLRFDGLKVQSDKNNIVITNVVDELSIGVILASGTKTEDIFVSSDPSFMFQSAADIECFDGDGRRIGYTNLEASWSVPTPRSYVLLRKHLGNEGDECWCCVGSVAYRRKLIFIKDYSITDPPRGCLVLPLRAHRIEMNIPVELSYNVKGTTNMVTDTFTINAEILLEK